MGLYVKTITLTLAGGLIVLAATEAAGEAPETHRWVTALKAGGFLGEVSGPVVLYPSLSYRLHPRHAVGLGAAWEYWRGGEEEHVIIIKAEYRARPFETDRDLSLYFNAGNAIMLPSYAAFGVYTAATGIGKEYRISDSFGFSLDLGLRGMYILFGAGVGLEATLGISN